MLAFPPMILSSEPLGNDVGIRGVVAAKNA